MVEQAVSYDELGFDSGMKRVEDDGKMQIVAGRQRKKGTGANRCVLMWRGDDGG